MDFIYCSDPALLPLITGVLQSELRQGDEMALTASNSRWGCVAAVSSRYKGLAPLLLDGDLYLAAGDPLILSGPGQNAGSPQACAAPEASARLRAIADKWKNSANPAELAPNHPAALLRALESSGELEVITDIWSAVPVYYSTSGGRLTVSGSPDLIALCTAAKVSRLSAVEFLSGLLVSFPHTLYENIFELPPASVCRLNKDGVSGAARYWVPPLPDRSRKIEEWRESFHERFRATLGRIAQELGSRGATTLSGGLDTRFVAAFALKEKLLELEAYTLSTGRNQEYWISRTVAWNMGIRHHFIKVPPRRDDSMLSSRLLASHQDRRHANYWGGLLGRIDAPFLLGGHFADTALFLGGRQYGIRKGLPAGSPRWQTAGSRARLSGGIAGQLEERWRTSDSLLGLSDGHNFSTKLIHPSLRAWEMQHVPAASREYPMYEPFLSRQVAELAFLIPDELKTLGKSALYQPYLAGLDTGIMAPGAQDVLKERAGKRFAHVSPGKRPAWASRRDPWQKGVSASMKSMQQRSRLLLRIALGCGKLGKINRFTAYQVMQCFMNTGELSWWMRALLSDMRPGSRER